MLERVSSARATASRVQERPAWWDSEALVVELPERKREEEGAVGDGEVDAKRISPICAITPASSQGAAGVRTAGRSSVEGGGGKGGAPMKERMVWDKEEEGNDEDEGDEEIGDSGSVGRFRRERRMERKMGRAVERLLFWAWWQARAVVAVRRFGVMKVALSLMMPVRVSTTLSTPTGNAPIAISRPQSYISSALDGRPLKLSQSA